MMHSTTATFRRRQMMNMNQVSAELNIEVKSPPQIIVDFCDWASAEWRAEYQDRDGGRAAHFYRCEFPRKQIYTLLDGYTEVEVWSLHEEAFSILFKYVEHRRRVLKSIQRFMAQRSRQAQEEYNVRELKRVDRQLIINGRERFVGGGGYVKTTTSAEASDSDFE